MEHPQGKRRRRAVLRRTERTLWVAGALLVALAGAGIAHRVFLGRKDVATFEQASVSAAVTAPTAAAALQVPLPDRNEWSDGRSEAWERARVAESGLPLALLKIPAIDLTVAVHRGTDELSLNRGAGWIAGTSLPGEPGNVGIAGHRDGFFRGLRRIEVGDRIELQTLDGSQVYEVEDLRIVDPENVEVLQPREQPAITLVTCYPFYWIGSAPQRFIVRGRRLQTVPEHLATGKTNERKRSSIDVSTQ